MFAQLVCRHLKHQLEVLTRPRLSPSFKLVTAVRGLPVSSNNKSSSVAPLSLLHCQCLTTVVIKPLKPKTIPFQQGERRTGYFLQLMQCRGKKSSQEKVDPRAIYLVYLSMAVGGALIGTILFSYAKNLYKWIVYGIETFNDPPFGRRQKLIKYKGVILPAMIENSLKDIRNFEVKADDVWVLSWPRSGTTWVQEIVYLIHSGLDISQEEEKNIEQRFYFLENVYPGLKAIAAKESPRLIKSHLPFQLLPEQLETVKPKIIYVMRNPKDVLISYYNFLKMLTPLKFVGTFEEFCDRFTKDKVYYSPWAKHVRAAVELQQQETNILILQYEELHKDLSGNVRRIAEFLGKNLTEKQIETVSQRCLFENMRKNNSVNYSWWDDYGIRDKTESQFLRQGKVGDWKHYLSPFISRRVEKMVNDNLSDIDLTIQYELPAQPLSANQVEEENGQKQI